MLEQVLTYLNNWFLVDLHEGTYTIENGSIALPFLQPGQYFRILGSVFNDGLYRYGDAEGLTDETFDGVIWALAVPRSVITLSEEIAEWQEKNKDAVNSPYTSESFGGYSYTKAAGGSNGAALTWQSVFSTRLNAFRKPRELGYVRSSSYGTAPYKRPYNPDYPWR